MIKLQIIGHLGEDCKTNEVNGKSVINFSVAHSEKFKDNQGMQKERTTWVRCAYWTDRTAVAQYLTRGKLVYTEGFPEAEAYTNKDGQPAASLKMRVMNLQLLGGSGGENTGSNFGQADNRGNVSNQGFVQPSATSASATQGYEPMDDSLPF